MQTIHITVFFAALGVSLLLTRLACWLAPKIGLVDRPDQRRKLHAHAVPLGGGVAIYLSTVAVVLTLAVVSTAFRAHVVHHQLSCFALALGGLAIVAVGVFDDRFRLRGRQKLLGQIGAAAILMAGGFMIDRFAIFGTTVELGLLAVPFTLFWFLGATNSLNLLDGIDGLAASIGLIMALAITGLATMLGQYYVATVAIILAGSLVGFLVFNLPPAKLFLGDSGSMLIGLWIGALVIAASLKGAGTVMLAAPLALWTIPIFDSMAAIIRRRMVGRSIFQTDRGHIHHRLLERFGTSRRVVLFIGMACALTTVAAIVSVYEQSDVVAVVICTTVVGMFIVTGVFGHVELLLLYRYARRLSKAVLPNDQQHVAELTKTTLRLQGSRDWDALWDELFKQVKSVDLSRIQLDINCPAMHEEYLVSWTHPDGVEEADGWHIKLPLILANELVGHVSFFGNSNGTGARTQAAKLLDLFELFEFDLNESTPSDTLPEPQAVPQHTVRPLAPVAVPLTAVESASDSQFQLQQRKPK